jgi:hypothetical protein
VARVLFFCLAVGFGLVAGPAARANPAPSQGERDVFLAGNLSPEQLVTLSSGLIASGHRGILLVDSAKSGPYHKLFLRAFQARRLIPFGSFPNGGADLAERVGAKPEAVVEWKRGPPLALWTNLFPRAEQVVVCPAEPYPLLLQAACLAGVAHAPLFVTHGEAHEAKELRPLLAAWHTKTILACGQAKRLWRGVPGLRVIRLGNEAAVAAAYLRRQLANGPIDTLVIANPADVKRSTGVMSPLAPWVALTKRAALVFTNAAGDNVGAAVETALKHRALRRVDNLMLVADLLAIPMERRPNPIPDGKDPYIEMEPLTPTGFQPFTFATGRLFNADPSVVALVLARERLLASGRSAPRTALVASNAGGGLPLLETFSRNTAKELRNRGYETTALFGDQVTKDDLRRLLPQQDVFLWEGHHSTLIKDYALPEWTEPLQPSLLFLQSCLALQDYKAQPLLERGALCVVGSSTRIYSASGGAFALCFFNALLYDQHSTGSSLRQAKNFLLAYARLKEKRLGKDAKLTAANLRSAWAFTLWGDPTLRLPPPESPDDALRPVRHTVRGNVITLALPDAAHDPALTAKYKARMLPNGRLAGLVSKDPDADRKPLVPFVFAEVALPHAPSDRTPALHTRLPSRRWVFCWDTRRRCGYLLVTPRADDHGELRFHVTWEPAADRRSVLGNSR